MLTKTTKSHLIGTIILSFFILFSEIMLPFFISASVAINPQSISAVWFNTEDVEEGKYKWNGAGDVNSAAVKKEWLDGLSQLTQITYTPENLLLNLSSRMSATLNNPPTTETDNSICDVIESGIVLDYVNEFVIMQAGHIIGNNAMPTPVKPEVESIIASAIEKFASENTRAWYEENKVSVIDSFCAYLMEANVHLETLMLEDESAFSESCAMIKLLNLSVLSYIFAGIAIVLTFFIFLMGSKILLFASMGSTAALASVVSFAIADEPIGLLILGIKLPLTGGAVAACIVGSIYAAVVPACAVLLIMQLSKNSRAKKREVS